MPTPKKSAKPTSKQKKLLIVEDDSFTLKLYAARFSEEGYTVTQTPRAKDVSHIIESEHPDLVILDMMLQDGNGFGVLEVIRSNKPTKNTPVIILSNLGQDSDITEAKKRGATKYFVKSNTRMQEVVDAVNKLLKKA